MARDYYAEAEKLADDARRAGFPDVADSVIRVIEEGFTSTEILLGIRSVLSEALPRLASAPRLRDDTISLIEGVNEALAE